jgi:Cdc6-like AAA superfamily ATPase
VSEHPITHGIQRAKLVTAHFLNVSSMSNVAATTARLVVVAISNTINLPEKLSTRVQSRIGGERCHFRSYNVEDTATILKTRLGMLGNSHDHPVFEEDAIKVRWRISE